MQQSSNVLPDLHLQQVRACLGVHCVQPVAQPSTERRSLVSREEAYESLIEQLQLTGLIKRSRASAATLLT